MGLSHKQFNKMVAEHTSLLMGICVGMIGDQHIAEDLVQETFSSAWKSRASCRSERGTEKAWLAQILKRRIVDQRRKPQIHTVPLVENSSYNTDPFKNEYSTKMGKALSKLPAILRDTLLLFVVDGLTHKETAAKLGIPLGTSISRVVRAKQYMHEHLGKFRG